ncbi:MAG TPA: Rv0909 family putative TA system antitoxin [Ornithinibacter sp.]|nr:Rv0909 family putative TA system antitoxin [Ornithinibacter sp.]
MARGAIKMAALLALAKQARDYARNNPETVNETIGKFEATVSSKLGPKYSAHVGKGGKALRSGLGISSATTRPGTIRDTSPTPPPPPTWSATPPAPGSIQDTPPQH